MFIQRKEDIPWGRDLIERRYCKSSSGWVLMMLMDDGRINHYTTDLIRQGASNFPVFKSAGDDQKSGGGETPINLLIYLINKMVL